MTINPIMDEGSVMIRRARKEHQCSGGHDGSVRVPCADPIRVGDSYVEYTGESHPFQSGRRYHPACALQQGLLIEEK